MSDFMMFATALADCGVDVVKGNHYPVIFDETAGKMGMLRIVDGSGESYLYSAVLFKVKWVEAK